jgi:hypothetical protein
MPLPETLIPTMEGTVGSLAGGKQPISTWLQACKAVMKSGRNRNNDHWEFSSFLDIDETSAAPTASSIAAGATIYGLLIGQNSSDASEDILAICEDGDGAIAAFSAADTIVANTNKIVIQIPAAAVDGTEDLTAYLFFPGITFTTFAAIVADGYDGTNPAADDIRVWVLYTSA